MPHDRDDDPDDESSDYGRRRPPTSRREALRRSLAVGSLLSGGAVLTPAPFLSSAAVAAGGKSRSEGYAFRRTEAEWSEMLTPTQFSILRNGGTEAPYSSILEGEGRPGTYVCAACPTPLFKAQEKFKSGTGWPSFAAPVMSASDASASNVEMEDVPKIQYQLAGAEVR